MITRHAHLPALLPALALLVFAGSAQADTLRQIFDKAWQLAPQARAAEARRGEAEASRGVAQSLLAGAPQITIGQRSDRWNDDLGKRENEVALALPLWLPGQRSAQAAVAAADGSATEQGITAARLALAGELRSALWNLILARNEAAITGQRLAALLKLEEDVARRVKAGDAARTDLLLAQQE
ncbi:MAG TPA: TolC family protein, partial [Rubrivivax sp.]|nr:TolC family protein [Rubrivivax sp.]